MKKFRAFTLAEVLITLMIIGVVAAITIPTLMNNINNNAMANQRKTAAAKIAEGFAQMRVAGALNETYADTMAFVNAMKKYFKINAVCKSTELASCFNSTVTTSDGTTETANNISEMQDVENVVGLILSDGTSMLIKYDKNADKIEEGQIEKVGYVKEANGNLMYATYGDLIKYIFDVNSSKGPNALLKDIVGNLPVTKGAPAISCTANSGSGFDCTTSDGRLGENCDENADNCTFVWLYTNDGFSCFLQGGGGGLNTPPSSYTACEKISGNIEFSCTNCNGDGICTNCITNNSNTGEHCEGCNNKGEDCSHCETDE